MKVFVAGSIGVVGRSLVPLLVEGGHEVTALVRSSQKGEEAEALGAKAAVADPLDREGMTAAVGKARLEVIIHQLTALAGAGRDLADVPRRGPRCQAAAPRAGLAGQVHDRRGRRIDDDAGPGRLQRQGEEGTGVAAALPVLSPRFRRGAWLKSAAALAVVGV